MKDVVNKEKQKAIINQVLDFLDCDNPKTTILEYLEDEFKEINKNSRDIGLKDINGKSIYADSSIVEFDYKYLSGLVEKCIGCFIYDKEELLYTIKLVGTPSENCIDYLKSSMSNFKIIDTIQENKL